MIIKAMLAVASLVCFAPKDVPQPDNLQSVCQMVAHNQASLSLSMTMGPNRISVKYRCGDDNQWFPVSEHTERDT